ncbi:Uncharacterised protein [Mycobacteroides abscessus subsp. abscessus]|nr:Uncharacterised protein [Mycobacteroides abscessus subsp. abscessus]
MDGLDRVAVGGGERQPVRPGRVSADLVVAEMVASVVVRAQGEQVGWVGVPALVPVDQVVVLEEAGGGAAGVAAALVAVLDELSGAFGDDAHAASDRDRDSVGVPYGADGPVAGVGVAQRGGEGAGAAEPADPVGVEVDQHPVPVPA